MIGGSKIPEGNDDGLLIQKVKIDDQGDYHCRVDFHNSPTRNVRIRLHIIRKNSFIFIYICAW